MLAALGACQSAPSFTVPSGPEHILFLIDGSADKGQLSSVARVMQSHLQAGDYGLHYRPATDAVTIAYFGFLGRTKARANTKLDKEFIHPVLLRSRKVAPERLTHLMVPTRTYRPGDSDWAVPAGLDRLKAGPNFEAQASYLVLVEQVGIHAQVLAPTARRRLDEEAEFVNSAVQLTKVSEFQLENVWVAIDRIASKTLPETVILRKEGPRPEHVMLAWVGGTLHAKLQLPAGLVGRGASVVVVSRGTQASSSIFEGRPQVDVPLGSNQITESSGEATLFFGAQEVAANPILGRQTFFREVAMAATLPDGPKAWIGRAERLLLLLVLIMALLRALFLLDRERRHGRPFFVWLPDYTNPFTLPDLHGDSKFEVISRAQSGIGEAALTLQLPNRWLCRLFYRKAWIRWDSRLQAGELSGSIAELKDLPRFVEFRWRSREVSGGDFDLCIERGDPARGHDRMTVSVRYFSLSDPDHLCLPSPSVFESYER